MFKVLLVDDEPLITQGLKSLIDWEDYGFEIVHMARDGEEALAFLQNEIVDVLITDIIMPKRTGLSLIKEAKKFHSELICIILSGYQEFQYVKEGIQLGIENYLVKPIDKDELLQTIETVKIKLTHAQGNQRLSSKTTLKENTLWRLLNGEIEKSEWEERLSIYNFVTDHPYWCVTLVSFEKSSNEAIRNLVKDKIEATFGMLTIFSPDQELIIIFHGETVEELYDYNEEVVDVLKSLDVGYFYVVMGDVISTMDKLEESYLMAREYSTYQILLEPNQLIDPQTPMDRTGLMQMQQNYQQGMVKRLLDSPEEAQQGIELFYEILTQQKFISIAVARKYTIDLISYIHHSIRDTKRYSHAVAIEKMVFATTIEEMKSILFDYCQGLIDTIDETQDERSPVVQLVLEHIHAHYAEELSLKVLSQRFRVNPIYLGQLFQREVGVTFSEYLNRYRLEMAKELLKTTHMKAGEIGKKVGYTDTTYFYKIFKKKVGTTPTEWRKI